MSATSPLGPLQANNNLPPPPTTLDWDGNDDPANPRNFSLVRRVFSIAAVTFLAFVSTLAAAIYSPSIPNIVNTFNVSEEVAILPLSLYNVGMAFGPLIGAPLSETAGRKVVFLVTTPIFALFVLGAGFSNSIASLIVCRFFAGAFAAPAISNASATIVDYTLGKARGVSLAIYYAIPTCGAVLAPLIGGFVVLEKGWRWTQWVTLFFIVAFYVPVVFTRESYKKTILQRRAKSLGLSNATSPSKAALWANVRHFATTLLIRPAHMLFTEPIVTLVCMYSGFIFGLIYTFVVASPWVYEHYYDFSLSSQALSFLGLIIGTSLAPIPLIIMDLLIYQPRLARFRATHSEHEQFPPENRLLPAMLGSLMLPTSLFAFAWTARPSIHWICPIIFQALASMSSNMIYAPVNMFMLDCYGPLYGASAAGATMLSRYTLSAAFPLFSLRMYKGLGVGWASSVLAFAALGMAPVPWLFWRFGMKLRERGRYEKSS